jgi:hypothetical protein
MIDQKLGKHFTIEEFEHSDTAIRRGIDNHMSDAIRINANWLCAYVLDPIREYYGKPLLISSGYRSWWLNKLIGSVNGSQHTKGEAADFTIKDISVDTIFSDMRQGNIKFPMGYDQVIQEFGRWIHISFRAGNNRNDRLIATREKSTNRITYTRV